MMRREGHDRASEGHWLIVPHDPGAL